MLVDLRFFFINFKLHREPYKEYQLHAMAIVAISSNAFLNKQVPICIQLPSLLKPTHRSRRTNLEPPTPQRNIFLLH